MPGWRFRVRDQPGGNQMTQSQRTQFVGVLLPLPLHVAVKTTAAQRGETVSDVIRQALAREIAQVSQAPKKAQPAQ
jgi:hypothetical protein